MNVVTSRPTLFAVNSHYNERGSWVELGSSEGLSVEHTESGVQISMGTAHEGDIIELKYDEARQLALWLNAACGCDQ